MSERIALVTGAGGALGSAISAELVARGWALALADRSIEAGDTTAEQIRRTHPGAELVVLAAELANAEEATGLIGQAVAWRGHLDGLVNNAGRPSRASLTTMTVDEWEQTLAVNLRAPMLLIQAFAAVRGDRVEPASIVNVASRTYATGGPAAYVTSKAGLVGLTRAAAVELGRLGIRVNAVAPSLVATPFTGGSRTAEELNATVENQAARSALGRPLELREIATAVAFLLGEDSSYVTGEVLNVAGGLQLPPSA